MSRLARKTNQKQVRMSFQGELLRVMLTTQVACDAVHPGGARKPITHFSRSSRKRLLDHMARIDWNNHKATFLTLTYHHKLPTARKAKTQLRAFLKRVYRRFGDIPVIWRIELQEDRYIASGEVAWHFHLLLIGCPYYHWADVKKDWRNVVNDQTIDSIKLRFLDNRRATHSYVCKYTAKVEEQGILDSVSNLAVYEDCGRLWGIENRKNLPLCELITYVLAICPEIFTFKRAARRYWSGVNTNGKHGFSLYVKNSKRWHDYLQYLMG